MKVLGAAMVYVRREACNGGAVIDAWVWLRESEDYCAKALVRLHVSQIHLSPLLFVHFPVNFDYDY